MDVHDLRVAVEATGSYFFDKETMKHFGDTLSNYRVAAKPVLVETWSGEYLCWALHRKRPVKMGLQSIAYFDCSNFQRVHAK